MFVDMKWKLCHNCEWLFPLKWQLAMYLQLFL